jgi:hypothetical protein
VKNQYWQKGRLVFFQITLSTYFSEKLVQKRVKKAANLTKKLINSQERCGFHQFSEKSPKMSKKDS